jgi:hypothetical protein
MTEMPFGTYSFSITERFLFRGSLANRQRSWLSLTALHSRGREGRGSGRASHLPFPGDISGTELALTFRLVVA